MMKTVIFQAPTSLSPYGFQFEPRSYRFPFSVVETDLIGSPEEKSQTKFCSLTVKISMELQVNWGLQKVAEVDFAKLLFEFGKRDIIKKIQKGILQEHETLLLGTATEPDHCPYEIARIDEPKGARIEVEENVMDKDAPSNPSLSSNIFDSQAQQKGIEIFFCYSHKDESLRDELEKHLRLLKREGCITTWHDRQITAGQEWEGEISKNLNRARVILLLISVDFIDSDYCWGIELKRAMAKHQEGSARVVPIILRRCDWHSAPFGKLQALPTDGRPVLDATWHSHDDAFFNITQGLRKVIKELGIS